MVLGARLGTLTSQGETSPVHEGAMMRISRTLVLTIMAFGLLAGACSDKGGGSGLAAFCETHTDPELDSLDPSNPDQAEALSAAMTKMAENAPEEIREDAETTREGFEAAQSGDIASIDVEEFQAAATRVEEYAEENCT